MEQCPRCETCKHWDQRHQQENLARYEHLVAIGSWTVQHVRREREEWDAEFGDCDALHEYESMIKKQECVDHWTLLPAQTHRTFGCVLHEPK